MRTKRKRKIENKEEKGRNEEIKRKMKDRG